MELVLERREQENKTPDLGFAVEDDWNTNLPYTSTSGDIFRHIAHNKGDESISDEDCMAAIAMVQAAIAEDRS